MGHLSKSCKGRLRCLKCGGAHELKECQSKEPRCCNCGEAHYANSKNCSTIQEAKEIEKQRSAASMNTSVTTEKRSENNANFQRTPGVQNENNTEQLNYSSAVKKIPNHRNIKPKTRTIGTQTLFASVATQTEDLEQENTTAEVAIQTARSNPEDQVTFNEKKKNTSHTVELQIKPLLEDFVGKLIGSLCETLSLNIQKETITNRKKLIYSCFQHHFKEFCCPPTNSTTKKAYIADPTEEQITPGVLSQDSEESFSSPKSRPPNRKVKKKVK